MVLYHLQELLGSNAIPLIALVLCGYYPFLYDGGDACEEFSGEQEISLEQEIRMRFF